MNNMQAGTTIVEDTGEITEGGAAVLAGDAAAGSKRHTKTSSSDNLFFIFFFNIWCFDIFVHTYQLTFLDLFLFN